MDITEYFGHSMNTTIIPNSSFASMDFDAVASQRPTASPANLSSVESVSSHGMLISYADPEEMLKPWRFIPQFVPVIITHAITFVLGVIGNTLIIIALKRDRSTRSATR